MAEARNVVARKGVLLLLPEVRRVWTEEGRPPETIDAAFARLWALVDRIAPQALAAE
jgi:hypothetical protein